MLIIQVTSTYPPSINGVAIGVEKIKEELQKKGYKIDKKQIELTNNITSLGYHKVIIKLYNKVDATIKIHVVK